MQSQIDWKRNIFRQSLRRQFIESYQRQIRTKYQLIGREANSQQKIKNNLMHDYQNIVQRLSEVERAHSDDICTDDNFDFFVRTLNFVAQKKIVGSGNDDQGTKCQSISGQVGKQQIKHRFPQLHSSKNISMVSVNSMHSTHSYHHHNSNIRISGVWTHKQNIYSIINRILRKVITQSSRKLSQIIDKILYLLQFPQLMPLWQQISSIEDQKIKNYCSKEFTKKLSKETNEMSKLVQVNIKKYNYWQIILDPDFVLDILVKFIIETPCIEFTNIVNLLPFICYALNIYKGKDSSSSSDQNKQQLLPRINKTCTILRNIMKDNGQEKLQYMIEEGFEHVFVFLMEEMCQMVGSRGRKMRKKEEEEQVVEQEEAEEIMDEERISQKGSKCRFQCGYIRNTSKQQSLRGSTMRKPINLITATKINLVKLLNRLFVVNKNIASYLYTKNTNYNLFKSLFEPFLINEFSCQDDEQFHYKNITCIYGEERQQWNQTSRQKYMLLCDSHRILLKSILTTLYIMLMGGNTSGLSNNFCTDFIQSGFIQFLSQCIIFQNISHDFTREITNIFLSLDSQNSTFYNKLTNMYFRKFLEIQLQLLGQWVQRYLWEYNQMKNCGVSKMAILIQLPWSLNKILKIIKHSILISFARATQPNIFQQISLCISYSQQYKSIFDYLCNIQCTSKNQQNQIRTTAAYIVQLCINPKVYLQKNSGVQLSGQGCGEFGEQ